MVLALGLALLWKLCWIDHRLSTRQSSKVTLAGQPILTLGHFYRPFMEIVAPFRTSGRFIWPLHYLWITVTVALWIIFYHSSIFIIYVIFIAVIIVQIIDFRGPVL
jgi:hypothetical protein